MSPAYPRRRVRRSGVARDIVEAELAVKKYHPPYATTSSRSRRPSPATQLDVFCQEMSLAMRRAPRSHAPNSARALPRPTASVRISMYASGTRLSRPSRSTTTGMTRRRA